MGGLRPVTKARWKQPAPGRPDLFLFTTPTECLQGGWRPSWLTSLLDRTRIIAFTEDMSTGKESLRFCGGVVDLKHLLAPCLLGVVESNVASSSSLGSSSLLRAIFCATRCSFPA